MNIKICTREEAGITFQQIADLMHASFQERVDSGLLFTCSKMSASDYENKLSGGTVIVAIDNDSGELLGTATVHIKTDRNGVIYGYNEYLGVSPKAKRLGIATKLLEQRIIIIIMAGGKYVMSDTACDATSSVKWHLKNGFAIYELESYRSTNYWSYVFIRPLSYSKKFSRNRIKLHFWKSWIFIKTTRHIDGTDSGLGKIFKMIKIR